MTIETHMLVPTEIDRENHRAALDVWNDCMMNAETLERTWPRLVKAIAAIDVTHTSQPDTGSPRRQQSGADNGGIELGVHTSAGASLPRSPEKVIAGEAPSTGTIADRLMDWSLNPGITDPLLVKELREASVSLSIFPPDPRDAERYRWLRLASVNSAISEAFVNVCESEPETPELFDAAIDKAMCATTVSLSRTPAENNKQFIERCAKLIEEHYWDSFQNDRRLDAHVKSLAKMIRALKSKEGGAG
jgi:hypothetical protein